MQTLRRSLASYERERARLEEGIANVRERRTVAERERESLADDVERLDAETAPLSERRAELERERHSVAAAVETLEQTLGRHEYRRDVLGARLKDLEQTPGRRFITGHKERALGLLGELVRAEKGWERALRAGLEPLSDAVVYADEELAIGDAADGDGATLTIAGGGPTASVLPGERTLLSVVDADASARGLVTTVLADIYLAETLVEATEKHRTHPKASFVTPKGVLLGPAVIRTAAVADSRAAEIRRELNVVEHDLARATSSSRPRRERLDAIAAEIDELTEQIERSDAMITRAADRIARGDAEIASIAKEDELLSQRLAGLDDAAAAWRDALAAAEPMTHEVPELPQAPEPPVQGRVAVETLRRDRAGVEERLASARGERDALAGKDEDTFQTRPQTARNERADAEGRLSSAETALEAAASARIAAAEADRAATEEEAESNRQWRDASTELDRLREDYQDEDRLRGDLERRIRDAERLLREGHQREPNDAVAELTEEATVSTIERRAELVQRRLGLLGRVNLLAGGEFEAMQERYDFIQRELDDVRKARRDLLEVIQRVETEIATTFEAAYRDVAAEFERLIAELFPGGEGRLIATEPGDLLNTGIEIEARPGRKRVKRISLVEGFAAESQVIIVTHQKRTMEVAGIMYGISMSKDGTSRVLAQRLDQLTDGIETAPTPRVAAVPESNHVG